MRIGFHSEAVHWVQTFFDLSGNPTHEIINIVVFQYWQDSVLDIKFT